MSRAPGAEPLAVPPLAAVPGTLQRSGGMACSRCARKIGLFEMWRYDAATGRCSACRTQVARVLQEFHARFIAACADAVLTPQEWHGLWQGFKTANGGRTDPALRSEALAFVRPDALAFLERNLSFAASGGGITPAEVEYLERMVQMLEIPSALAQPLRQRMERVKALSRMREGHLTPVKAGAHLQSDEICYLAAPVTYHKVGARSTTLLNGLLLGTDRKLHFIGASTGWAMLYDKVMGVTAQPGGVCLEATARGGGFYACPDPEWAEAVIETLTRRSKRQIVMAGEARDSRHIPQHVMTAVWQRDGGKCVECAAASYLEFDHVIPWAKGGATSAENLQLLCRKCNGAKRDRI